MDNQPVKTNRRDLLIVVVLLVLVIGIGAYLILSQKQRTTLLRENTNTEKIFPNIPNEPVADKLVPGPDEVFVYFVDLQNTRNTKPVIGCGDSLSPITRSLSKAGKNTSELIKAALGFLFEPKDQYVGKGGLYNALYQSDLAVDKVTIDKGIASVFLTGTYKLGGECDDPRFEAQIKQTVLQFSEVKSVLIFVNGTQLNLSLK